MVKPKKFFCQKCPAKFAHKYLLDIHLVTHGGATMYPCSYCDWDFFNEPALRTHSGTDHPDKPVIVIKRNTPDESGNVVISESQRDRTWSQKLGKLSNLDKSIFKPINWLALAVKQEQEETGSRNDETVLPDGPSSSSSSSINIKTEPLDDDTTGGSQPPKLELSSIIKKRFSQLQTSKLLPLPKTELIASSFRKERQMRSLEKDFDCIFCDRHFDTREHLKQHLEMHNEKVHICEVCGVRFNRLRNLQAHALTHGKSFECDICKKSFMRARGLSQHKATYHNRKRYVCLICGATFTQRSILQDHELKHTAVDSFNCTKCKKRFINQHNLDIHMARHQPKPFCSICLEVFKHEDDLKKHTDLATCVKPEPESANEDDEATDISDNEGAAASDEDGTIGASDEDSLDGMIITSDEDDDENSIGRITPASDGDIDDPSTNKSESFAELEEKDNVDSLATSLPEMWCRQCEKCFDNQSLFQQHMDFHKSHPFACMDCGEQMNNLSEYKKHLKEH